ncbi:MAG: hypothetical protein R3C42_07320 [Parvularculaceae bacterium]|nr:hypothetical protein [Parvularculaceae bacterium]
MNEPEKSAIEFVRLRDVDPDEILSHMRDPRIAAHLPLLTSQWDSRRVEEFIEAKEDGWRRDGLGCWAILHSGAYAGWGGFQREGEEWDFALVLTPDSFGLGPRITKMAIDFARNDRRISYATFLLPPSRRNFGALKRLGARHVGTVDYQGAAFLKYRLDTE